MKKYGIGVNVENTGRVEGWNNLLTVSDLYIPSARPDSKYIVESRAEFTDISGFYGTVTGSVVPNLITSGKSVTTLEAPKNPVVKPVTKVEQNIETVKQPAVTSEKPKTVERSHSQGSNNHNSNKESFNQKTEKNISSQNYHSGFTDEINSTAFTADRNISASKISNNGFDHVFRNKKTGEVNFYSNKNY